MIGGLDPNGCKIKTTILPTGLNNETESEAKVIKKALSVAFAEDDQQDDVTIWVVAPCNNS